MKALSSRQEASALVEFDRAIQLNPRLDVAWHGRGVAYFNQGQYPDAVTNLKQAVSLNPQQPEYFKNLAFALTKTKQHDEAIDAILQGESHTDLSDRGPYKRFVAQIYDSRAVQRTKHGDDEGALADLDEAIRWDDSYPDAFDDRGSIRFNSKQYAKALKDFTRAIEFSPRSQEFLVHRGHALKALGRHKDAQADYEAARRLEQANGK